MRVIARSIFVTVVIAHGFLHLLGAAKGFGWLNLSRRLSKDYEVLPASGETFIRLAMLSIMLRRLA